MAEIALSVCVVVFVIACFVFLYGSALQRDRLDEIRTRIRGNRR